MILQRLVTGTRDQDDIGDTRCHGFLYQVYLATDALGGAGNDADLGGTDLLPGPVLADPAGIARQEYYWCAYAWPAGQHTGTRAFFVDHQGTIYQTYGDALKYGGAAVTLGVDAAYGGAVFTSHPGSGVGNTGNDGNSWTAVQ